MAVLGYIRCITCSIERRPDNTKSYWSRDQTKYSGAKLLPWGCAAFVWCGVWNLKNTYMGCELFFWRKCCRSSKWEAAVMGAVSAQDSPLVVWRYVGEDLNLGLESFAPVGSFTFCIWCLQPTLAYIQLDVLLPWWWAPIHLYFPLVLCLLHQGLHKSPKQIKSHLTQLPAIPPFITLFLE